MLYYGPLVLAALQCYYGDNEYKNGLLPRHLFQRTQQCSSCKKYLDKNKFV